MVLEQIAALGRKLTLFLAKARITRDGKSLIM
jgi:hypothetical protein